MALNFFKLLQRFCNKVQAVSNKNGITDVQISPLKCLPPCSSIIRIFVNKNEKSNKRRTFETYPNNFPFLEILGWSTVALVGLQYVVLHHQADWSKKSAFKKSKHCPLALLRQFDNKVIKNVLSASSDLPRLESKQNYRSTEHTEKSETLDEIIHETEALNVNFHKSETSDSAFSKEKQINGAETSSVSQESENILTDPLKNLKEAGNVCASAVQNDAALHLLSEQNYKEALHLFKTSCRLGSENACFNAGLCYELGLGAKQDLMNAKKFYKLAAEKGHTQALYNLGVICLQENRNNLESVAYGIDLAKRAAEQGLYEAHVMLGIYFMEKNNPIEAIPYLEVAAEQGHSAAEFYLGVCNEKGWGMKKDLNKAASFYSKAAEKGHADALYNLGVFHEFELGGLFGNKKKALELYQKAKENGHAIAAQRLTDLQNEVEEIERCHENLSTIVSLLPVKIQESIIAKQFNASESNVNLLDSSTFGSEFESNHLLKYPLRHANIRNVLFYT